MTPNGSGPAPAVDVDDFTLEAVDFRWSMMTHHPCRKRVRFVNPTRDRVDWYRRCHRCDGLGWTR